MEGGENKEDEIRYGEKMGKEKVRRQEVFQLLLPALWLEVS